MKDVFGYDIDFDKYMGLIDKNQKEVAVEVDHLIRKTTEQQQSRAIRHAHVRIKLWTRKPKEK